MCFYFYSGIWSPNSKSSDTLRLNENSNTSPLNGPPQPPPLPVWTPRSAGPSPTLPRKEFRPVNFESPTFSRKVYTRQVSQNVYYSIFFEI